MERIEAAKLGLLSAAANDRLAASAWKLAEAPIAWSAAELREKDANATVLPATAANASGFDAISRRRPD